jgi:cytochrome c oxidase subunit 1
MLGAKALAFPRLNLLSFHLYSFGAIVILASILAGGLDTGWTLYAPYSTHISPFSNALMYGVFGILILSFSYILMAINFIATIHNKRIKGLTWTRLPLFVWTLYAASFVKLLATPVLTLTTVLILLERIFQIGIFNPAQGGDPSLFQHFFWFYAQPAQYIALLSAFGLISEMLSVHSRKPIFGYLPFVASSALVALLCFFIWGHQMPVSGQSHLTNVLFSLFSLLLILPIVFMLFSWLATLYGGVIRLNTPMLYTLSAILMLAIGISANFITGAITLNAFLHNTYFATAQLHYLLMGTATVALIGGIYHWWPKISGRMYCELWGRIGAIAVFVGFNITFFAKFLLGIYGMPQRYHTYAQLSSELTHTYHLYHSISTYGSWLLALGIAIAVMTPILSLRNAKDAPANPWAASTLEWQTQSPPTSLNFDEPLDEVRHEPYQYAQLDQSAAKGQS